MVLPNGIDMENFHPHHTVKHFKAQLGIPENSQIITYCSRLDWGKPLLPKLLFLHVLL
ncbi:hypothetical protein JQ035_00960 [Clostridium botulinum]|nr:hypothetical protein [Clostridium botulinum]